jgi:hypothetical protein
MWLAAVNCPHHYAHGIELCWVDVRREAQERGKREEGPACLWISLRGQSWTNPASALHQCSRAAHHHQRRGIPDNLDWVKVKWHGWRFSRSDDAINQRPEKALFRPRIKLERSLHEVLTSSNCHRRPLIIAIGHLYLSCRLAVHMPEFMNG